MIKEVLMEKFKRIEEEVRKSHRRLGGRLNVSQAWRLVKSYFPEVNPAPSHLEKALLKNVMSVCEKSGVSFEDFVAQVAEKKDELTREKSLRTALGKSVIFFLDNPITYKAILNQQNDGPEIQEAPKEEHTPVVIFPTRGLFVPVHEFVRLPFFTRNGKISNACTLTDVLKVLREHKRYEFSNEDFKSEFIQYLLNKGQDPNDYKEEVQFYETMDRRKAVEILKSKIKEGVKCL
jgi:hypothetical protein